MDSKKSLKYSYSHAVAGQEDCLYLNIYSPVSAGSEGAAALPVMVWIYGGGYSVGYNTAQGYGPQKFMDTQQVILVTEEMSGHDIKLPCSGDHQLPSELPGLDNTGYWRGQCAR